MHSVKKGFLSVMFLMGIISGYAQSKDTASPGPLIAPWWVEKFRVTAGFFESINSTKIQVGADGLVNGTEIDFHKDLGFGASFSTFLTNFQWRISRRSRLNLGYFNMSRSATHTLQKDIIFDSTTYPANSPVKAHFNTTIFQFSYGYAIVQKPSYEIGLSIGAHTIAAKVGISLNNQNIGAYTSSNFDITAPLPDLGIWGGYSFSKRFAVNLDLSYLSMTVNNIYGRVIAYNLAFSYQLIPRLYLSFAYTGLDFGVKTTRKDVTGDFKWGYNGPTLCASFSFGSKSWSH
jgi:hypothetical protein